MARKALRSGQADAKLKKIHMAEHNRMGISGEDAASAYLFGQGYRIWERNWKSGHKELDIIAEKDGVLVVVEVKTRYDTRYGRPEDAVNTRKIRLIVMAAEAYVRMHRLDMPVRFDIITVTGPQREVRHIPDAFRSPAWYR